MVDVSIIEAILSIPGALQASRDFLARKKPDPKAALQELDNVRANLLVFSAIGAWFDEVKQLHQNLQNVDVALEPCVRCYSQATASGVFVPERYPLGTARDCWNVAKPHSLNRLIDSLGSMRYVTETILVETEGGGKRRIPRWGAHTVELKVCVDNAFAEMDRRPSTDQVRKAGVALKTLADHIKNRMIIADREIRDRATEISEALARLERDLQQ